MRIGIMISAMLVVMPAHAQTAPAVAAAPSPIDPARRIAARAVVDEVLPAGQRQKMFAQLVDAMVRNMSAGMMQGDEMQRLFAEKPKAEAIFTTFVDRQRDLALADLQTHMPELLDAYTDAYARTFDVEELARLKAWLGAPLGQKYIGFAFAIANDPGVAAWQRGVAERGHERLPGELARLKAELKPVLDDGAKHGT